MRRCWLIAAWMTRSQSSWLCWKISARRPRLIWTKRVSGSRQRIPPRRAQYELCLWALTLDAYDQRGSQQDQPLKPNPALRYNINQLKLTEGEPIL